MKCKIFVGFNKTAEELGFKSINYWYCGLGMPVKQHDYDTMLENFHKDPLNQPLMAFLSFPSTKDTHYNTNRPQKAIVTCVTEVSNLFYVLIFMFDY